MTPPTPRARPPAGRSESPRTGLALGGDRALLWSALGARPWPSEAWLWRAGGVRPGLPPGPQGLCPIDAKTDFLPEKRKGEYCLTLDANTRTLVALSVGVRGRYPAPAMLAPRWPPRVLLGSGPALGIRLPVLPPSPHRGPVIGPQARGTITSVRNHRPEADAGPSPPGRLRTGSSQEAEAGQALGPLQRLPVRRGGAARRSGFWFGLDS